MKFRVKKISSQNDFSDILRRSRETKGLLIEDISKELKIPFNFIKVLEVGGWRNLPLDVYAKKHLFAYLKFLGEEAENLYPLFLQEWQGKNNERDAMTSDVLRTPDVNRKFTSTYIVSHILRKIGIFIIIFLFFGYLSLQFYNFFRPPSLEIFFPADNLVVYTPLLAVEGETEKETPLFINDVEVMLSRDGAFKEEVGLQKGVNIIKIEAVKKYGGKCTIFKKVLFE